MFHRQTLVRFVEKNTILFTRTDYFNRDDYEDEDYEKTDLDVKLDLYRSKFENNKVVSISVTNIANVN